jgi:DNA (cytosine-5)-methyltransferase 1
MHTEFDAVQTEGAPAEACDSYHCEGGRLQHRLRVGELNLHSSVRADSDGPDAKGAWWRAYLAGETPRPEASLGGRLRTIDLFCGPGGLANGVRQLCTELGISMVSEFIVDQDVEATRVYSTNHVTRGRTNKSVRTLIDYGIRKSSDGASFTYSPELVDAAVGEALHGIDLVLAGPPCQGHSNLNNETRRVDPRNSLYLTVPAFATAVGAPMCIIENVPAVLNDQSGVVETALQLFASEGYDVTMGMLSASKMGWPQTRKRHFLVARRDRAPIPLKHIAAMMHDEPRSLWWAIEHLEDSVGEHVMDQVSDLSSDNQARIDWLFDNDEHELALAARPESHRNGTSYTAVYGRLWKDRPAPTITTGFMTPGRGRYTHPTRRRVLTPREAARLQGFSDSYRFVVDPAKPPSRKLLAKWIGDAVPMPLGYAAAVSVLGGGVPAQQTHR